MSGYSGCNWDHGFQPTTGFIFLPSERGIQVTNIWNMWMGWNRPPVMTRGMDISYGRMISWSFLKMVAADPISISSSPIHHSIVLGPTIAWPIPSWTPSPGCQHLPPSGRTSPWQQQQRPCDQWCCCPVHRGSSRGKAKSQDHSASVQFSLFLQKKHRWILDCQVWLPRVNLWSQSSIIDIIVCLGRSASEPPKRAPVQWWPEIGWYPTIGPYPKTYSIVVSNERILRQ